MDFTKGTNFMDASDVMGIVNGTNGSHVLDADGLLSGGTEPISGSDGPQAGRRRNGLSAGRPAARRAGAVAGAQG
jgi:hypothetical protein